MIRLQYREENHRSLPHVLNISGGRTSGMLLHGLLDNGGLSAERGERRCLQ